MFFPSLPPSPPHASSTLFSLSSVLTTSLTTHIALAKFPTPKIDLLRGPLDAIYETPQPDTLRPRLLLQITTPTPAGPNFVAVDTAHWLSRYGQSSLRIQGQAPSQWTPGSQRDRELASHRPCPLRRWGCGSIRLRPGYAIIIVRPAYLTTRLHWWCGHAARLRSRLQFGARVRVIPNGLSQQCGISLPSQFSLKCV